MTQELINQRSADGFRTALAVFQENAPLVLGIDITIKGRPMHTDLLNLLSLGDSYDDPNALNLMADKLPGMLVFYGLALMEAEESLASIEEEIDLFVQRHWQETLEELIKALDGLVGTDGKKIPASLKGAPTKDGIRAAIINSNKASWDELSARKTTAVTQVKTLSNIHKGIEQRSRLLNSQLQVTNSMVLKGIGRQ